VNLCLGDVDGLYHHHYGIGAVDHIALSAPEHDGYEKRLIAELLRRRRLERGGTMVMAHHSFGCKIEEAFIESYRDGSFQYVLIAADRVRNGYAVGRWCGARVDVAPRRPPCHTGSRICLPSRIS